MSATGRKRKDGKKTTRKASDFYPSPPYTVHALLREVWLPGGRWLEPTAGDGAIIRAVNEVRTDIEWTAVELRAKEKRKLQALTPHVHIGSLFAWDVEDHFDVAMGNPPFSLARECVDFVRKRVELVVFLLRVGFAGTAIRNAWIRETKPDAHIVVPRPSFTGGGNDSSEYSWLVWERRARRRPAALHVLRTWDRKFDRPVQVARTAAEFVYDVDGPVELAIDQQSLTVVIEACTNVHGGAVALPGRDEDAAKDGCGSGASPSCSADRASERAQEAERDSKAAQRVEDVRRGDRRALPCGERDGVPVANGSERSATGLHADAREPGPRLVESNLIALHPIAVVGEPVSNAPAPSARHVVAVESNIKGGVACRLGPKTLLVGDFGSGKSALINSVELALSGRASDIIGRDLVALPGELLQLGDDNKVFARVQLSDGAVASYAIGGSRSKTKSAEHALPASIDPNRVFPLRTVRDAILGSVDTTRKFFLTIVAGNVKNEDILSRVPPMLHPYYAKALVPAQAGASAVDRLLVAIGEAGKQARETKGRAKGSAATSEAAAQGLAPAPTEEQLVQAKVAVDRARFQVETVAGAKARGEQAREARVGVDQLRAQIEAMRAEVVEKREMDLRGSVRLNELRLALGKVSLVGDDGRPAAPPPLTELQRANARVVLAVGEEAQKDTTGQEPHSCMACGLTAPSAHFVTRALVAKTRLDARRRDAEQRIDIERRIETGERYVTDARARIAVLQADIARSEQLLTATTGPVEQVAIGEEDVVKVRAALDEAEKALRGFEATKAAWDTVRKANEASTATQQEVTAWTSLIDALDKVVGELLDGGTASFVARVQAYLPPGFVFDLKLREGAREVCRHGFIDSPKHKPAEKGKRLHTALSGAEWVIEQIALAGAIAEIWAKDGQPFVLVPDDRGFSVPALEALLGAFVRCAQQVIVATPTRPVNVPPGWTVIDTDKGEHQTRVVIAPSLEQTRPPEPTALLAAGAPWS